MRFNSKFNSWLTAMVTAMGLTSAFADGPSKLPTFSLPDLDGKEWTSSQLIGKPVVIDFWATWCNTCEETIPKLAELQTKFSGQGLTVVGISVDKGSAEKIRKSAKRLGINYLVLLDKENSLSSVFGFKGIPSLYVFDRAGQMKTAMPGYDPDQEKQLEQSVVEAMKGPAAMATPMATSTTAPTKKAKSK